jgi:hypothetical protein
MAGEQSAADGRGARAPVRAEEPIHTSASATGAAAADAGRRRVLALAAASTLLWACSGNGEAVLVDGEKVAPEVIDKDPLALLPSGAIMVSRLDAQAMFRSGFGSDAARLIANLIPLGPESGFVAQRDISTLHGGLYAMQGADFCLVAQGNFDRDAIQRAADARAVTVAGMPLVKSHYAGFDLYTAGNVGFVVLTSRTALSGNETGMRRALDRLRFSKLERSQPEWAIKLMETQNASFAVAGDLTTQPGAAAVAASSLPFVAGLQYVRVLGNFQPPGVNFAGALTYGDAQQAAAGAAALANVRSFAAMMSLATVLFGGSIPNMQVAQSGNDVAFTLPLDDRLMRLLLGRVIDATRPGASPAR